MQKLLLLQVASGKTTAKEMSCPRSLVKKKKYSLLENHLIIYLVSSSQILNMPKNGYDGIFELGMNHKNELTKLVEILKPKIG